MRKRQVANGASTATPHSGRDSDTTAPSPSSGEGRRSTPGTDLPIRRQCDPPDEEHKALYVEPQQSARAAFYPDDRGAFDDPVRRIHRGRSVPDGTDPDTGAARTT